MVIPMAISPRLKATPMDCEEGEKLVSAGPVNAAEENEPDQ